MRREKRASTREEGKGKESQQVESTVRRVKRIIIRIPGQARRFNRIPGGRIYPREKTQARKERMKAERMFASREG